VRCGNGIRKDILVLDFFGETKRGGTVVQKTWLECQQPYVEFAVLQKSSLFVRFHVFSKKWVAMHGSATGYVLCMQMHDMVWWLRCSRNGALVISDLTSTLVPGETDSNTQLI
jgi:hypothetical protein